MAIRARALITEYIYKYNIPVNVLATSKYNAIKKRHLTLGIFGIALMATVVIIASVQKANMPESEIIQQVSVRWTGYQTLKNMTDRATDIVIAKVAAVKGSSEGLMPTSDFEVTVEKAIKGNLRIGDAITVRQVGLVGSTKLVTDSEVFMRAGEEYVLLLIYTPETITYSSVGGPQGRFLIQNSMVYSMDNIDERANWVYVKIRDVALNSFLSEISETLKEGATG